MNVSRPVPDKRLHVHVCAVLLLLVTCSRLAQGQERCNPNYAHPPCVPIAHDVDCAGGNGNGPAYVEGPVRVIGEDVYGLDRDGDGIACEPKKKKKK